MRRCFTVHDAPTTRAKAYGWPTVYLIDAKGVIRYVNPQRQGGPQAINKGIETLLAEIGHEVDLSEDDEKDDDGNDEKDTDVGAGF